MKKSREPFFPSLYDVLWLRACFDVDWVIQVCPVLPVADQIGADVVPRGAVKCEVVAGLSVVAAVT